MSERDRLEAIFNENSTSLSAEIRHEHAHRHMLALAELLTGWAMDGRFDRERSATLLGWAESWERLAEEVGPDWSPPEPEQLSLLQFVARTALGEPTAGRTPNERRRG